MPLMAQQDIDTIKYTQWNTPKFTYQSLVAPAVLVGYGVIGIESDQLKFFNTQIREEMEENHGSETIGVDDFSQYAPGLAVYGLNLVGIQGKHNFKDRTVILATSYLIMSSTVLSLKSITHIQRPDGSAFNSFPSGHTATAFMGAEFLYQEYKDVSPWYGITGYAVAAGTGYLRMYNKRHWLTDIAAGAGIGIVSTKIAYWLYPTVHRWFYKKETSAFDMEEEANPKRSQTMVMPFYNGQQAGLALSITF